MLRKKYLLAWRGNISHPKYIQETESRNFPTAPCNVSTGNSTAGVWNLRPGGQLRSVEQYFVAPYLISKLGVCAAQAHLRPTSCTCLSHCPEHFIFLNTCGLPYFRLVTTRISHFGHFKCVLGESPSGRHRVVQPSLIQTPPQSIFTSPCKWSWVCSKGFWTC